MNKQEPQNDLQELNSILFNTLRNLEGGSIELDHAKGVANLGNTIINNAKAQLDAYKLTNGRTKMTLMPDAEKQYPVQVQAPPKDKKLKKLPTNTYDRQMLFAEEKGYKSPAMAIMDMGKHNFTETYTKWEENHAKK